MTNTFKYLGLILLLIVIGYLIEPYFLQVSFSQMTNESIQIASQHVGGHFYSRLLFALFIGGIPLLYLIVKKTTQINFKTQGLISLFIMVGSGILLWIFRVFQLKSRHKIYPKYPWKMKSKYRWI